MFYVFGFDFSLRGLGCAFGVYVCCMLFCRACAFVYVLCECLCVWVRGMGCEYLCWMLLYGLFCRVCAFLCNLFCAVVCVFEFVFVFGYLVCVVVASVRVALVCAGELGCYVVALL